MKRLSDHASLLLLGLAALTFGMIEPRFWSLQNLTNMLTQSSSAIVAATGMTFVLLTAGVDLSVGAIMFLCAAVAGKLALAGQPLALCAAAMLGCGVLCGAVNAAAIVWLRVLPFIVTLATLYLGRGLALNVTETRAMNLPEAFLAFGRPAVAIGIAATVALLAEITLRRTVYGRHLYAVGAGRRIAEYAGLPAQRLTFSVYVVCGMCAALAALLTMGQLGAVSPKFGENREFTAIAAAVLGGTSLFGGRGGVFPGAVFGALLMQCIESGLVMVNANPYLYPMIMASVIFAAVLLDARRRRD
jgi:ribose/xylose/arabinose/galactoside ABC-type transport system permease subunit